ncbi:MAG TPA: hypothetical protein DCE78_12315 [Bacteroidetes bacterium]|nr:hypothetical protein [Bacteroidota bacterium]
MIKRILLWLILLFVTIFLYSLWKISSSERKLFNTIQTELAPSSTTAGISVASVEILAFEGNVVFYNVTYFESAGQPKFTAQKMILDIGTSASFKLAVLPAEMVFNQLDETHFTATEFKDEFGDDLASNATVSLLGNPLQLLNIPEESFPTESLTLKATISALNFGAVAAMYPAVGLFIPNDPSTEFRTQIQADPQSQQFLIEFMELDHADFLFNLQGIMSPEPNSNWENAPVNGEITVTQLSPAMKNLVSNLEMLFEIKLPRRNDDIVIPIRGTVSRPLIQP